MQRAIERGDFLETATFSGNMYGTRYTYQINFNLF